MKKIFKVLFVVLLSFTIIGCEKEKEENNTEKENNNEIGVLKCDVFECINKLNVEDDVDSINEKLGIKSTKNKYVDNAYEWDLNDEVKLRATYNADGISLLEVLFDRMLVKDDGVNASLLKEVFDSARNYDDAISLLGKGGTIISRKFLNDFGEKYSETNYIWVRNEECYLIGYSSDLYNRYSSSKMVTKGC